MRECKRSASQDSTAGRKMPYAFWSCFSNFHNEFCCKKKCETYAAL